MNFAGALFALQRGHKVKRHHWTGYWKARQKPGTDVWKIMMHTWNGKEIDITETNDIFYTLSNCACDDWEIVEDWDKNTTQPDYMNVTVQQRKIEIMTMTNAEWCIQHGIKFKNLSCKSCGDRHECIGYYDIDGIFHECYKGKELGDLVVESILTWLDMDHVEPILDDVEKRYLKGVVRPFRDDVQYIVKYAGKFSSRAYEEISIRYKDKMCEDKHSFSLPRFDKGTMYKGMEVNRHYTLRDLGL